MLIESLGISSETSFQCNPKSLYNSSFVTPQGGPPSSNSLSNGKKRGNGRVNCIAFDPVDANIIWVGSPAGGLWKSIDGGNNWTTNTDNLPVLGVSHIAIDPNDKYQVISKPHGHGDVHFLMYKEGLAKQWLLEGKKWVFMVLMFLLQVHAIHYPSFPLKLYIPFDVVVFYFFH